MDLFFFSSLLQYSRKIYVKDSPCLRGTRGSGICDSLTEHLFPHEQYLCHLCSEAMHLSSTVCTHFLLIHGTDSKDGWYIWPPPTQSRFKGPAPHAEDPLRSGFKYLMCPELGPHRGAGLWCRTLLQGNSASSPPTQPFHRDAVEI